MPRSLRADPPSSSGPLRAPPSRLAFCAALMRRYSSAFSTETCSAGSGFRVPPGRREFGGCAVFRAAGVWGATSMLIVPSDPIPTLDISRSAFAIALSARVNSACRNRTAMMTLLRRAEAAPRRGGLRWIREVGIVPVGCGSPDRDRPANRLAPGFRPKLKSADWRPPLTDDLCRECGRHAIPEREKRSTGLSAGFHSPGTRSVTGRWLWKARTESTKHA